MTTDKNQPLFTAEEDFAPNQEGSGRPRGPLRFPMPEGEGPADRSQSSSPKQPLSGGTSLPWSTWFLGLLGVTILFLCGISLWDTLNGLWEHSAVVGMAGLVLIGLLTLVTTLSYYLYVKIMKENKPIYYLFYILVNAVGMYTHYFFFLVLLNFTPR